MHDCLASHLSSLPDETEHGVCNTHLLHNLEEIVEQEKEPNGWAVRMQRLLLKTRDVAVHGFDTVGSPVPEPEPSCQATTTVWDAFLALVLDRYESLSPPALALWTLRDACLTVHGQPCRALANNLAEQALRMTKLQMKILSGFRTRAGAERFVRMRGLMETARKQERNLLDLLWLGPYAPVPWLAPDLTQHQQWRTPLDPQDHQGCPSSYV
ncbi:MAG: hypothetical protein F4Y80_01175 [Caldilineaceae bacterium SB0665_bin_21]|nr:hypothetical protein [Caldilineaceae bacterium SB0665_bin_21]